MAYNHGREDRKWRIWKEAEEKLLRECGVDEVTIEQIRISPTNEKYKKALSDNHKAIKSESIKYD